MHSYNIISIILSLAIIKGAYCGGPTPPCNATKLFDSNSKYLKSICVFDTAVSISDAIKTCEALGTKLIDAHNPETLTALGVYLPWITYEDSFSYWTTIIDDVCYEILNDNPWITYVCNCELNSNFMCEFIDPKA